jgi:hypothetical protein
MNAMQSLGAETYSTSQQATVLSCEARRAQILTREGPQEARVALSCLVQPAAGDIVLATQMEGAGWILAVLERPVASPLQVLIEGDLTVAATGHLRLAGMDVGIDAAEAARLTASSIDVQAATSRSVIDEALHVGRKLTSHVAKLKLVSDLIETLADHVLQRARRSTRMIEETEHLRAGEIDLAATGTVHVQAKQAFISADTVVRIDAAQIHMG